LDVGEIVALRQRRDPLPADREAGGSEREEKEKSGEVRFHGKPQKKTGI
jgi:hypothetical protein